ncbi:MAG: hypothetical protein WCW65_03125 [Candidatus Paceibacterota bacterium]
MIKFPFKFKEGELEIDFNWSEEVIPCKEVKITLGDKEVILTREKFSTLMAIFADDKQMEDIIQTQKTDFVSITRMLRIKTTKDLKAEESIVFPYTYWIPRTEYEKLKEDGEMVRLVEDNTKSLAKYISENEAAKEVREMMLTGQLSKKVV